jgi:hypothetical protein
MSLSAFARLLYIGLWTEAYDDGVFEWKPLTLKARIFPVDNVDMVALLAELVASDCIAERGKYGLIRNFRHYQRPKKPNSSGVLSEQDQEYVGLVPNQFPTGSEISPQMEDGGGNREDEDIPPVAPPGGGAGSFEELERAYPKSRHTVTSKAKRLHGKLSPSEHAQCIIAAHAYRAEVAEDMQRRGRDADAHACFVKGMDTWLREGLWKARASPQTDTSGIVVLSQSDPDYGLALSIVGQSRVGKSGNITIKAEDLEKARTAA